MRDIRFRCWDKQEKRMTPSFPIYKCTGDPDGRYIFLQWTGFHDKKGHKIYEGDIISGEGTDFNTLGSEIIFLSGSFSINIDNEYQPDMWQLDFDTVEIIGHIYMEGV